MIRMKKLLAIVLALMLALPGFALADADAALVFGDEATTEAPVERVDAEWSEEEAELPVDEGEVPDAPRDEDADADDIEPEQAVSPSQPTDGESQTSPEGEETTDGEAAAEPEREAVDDAGSGPAPEGKANEDGEGQTDPEGEDADADDAPVEAISEGEVITVPVESEDQSAPDANGEIEECEAEVDFPEEFITTMAANDGNEAVPYPVWVNGVQVTNANMGDVLGDGMVQYKHRNNNGRDGELIFSGNPTFNGEHEDALIYTEEGLAIGTTQGLVLNLSSDTVNYGVRSGKGVGVTLKSDTVIRVKSVPLSIEGDLEAKGSLDLTGNGDYLISTGRGIEIKSALTGKNTGGGLMSGSYVTIKSDADVDLAANGKNLIDTKGSIEIRCARIRGENTSGGGLIGWDVTLEADAVELTANGGELIKADYDIKIKKGGLKGENKGGPGLVAEGNIVVTGDVNLKAQGDTLMKTNGYIKVFGILKGESPNGVGLKTNSEITVEGDVDLKANGGYIIDSSRITINGNVKAVNNAANGKGFSTNGPIIMKPGAWVWDIAAGNGFAAICAGNSKGSVKIPETHAIVLPEGGQVSPVVDGNAVLTPAGDIASHVIISHAITVTYDKNGGAGSMDAQKIYAGLPTTLRANAFTRDGCTFEGWNTAANGSGTSYADGAQATLRTDATLFAQWKTIPTPAPVPAPAPAPVSASGAMLLAQMKPSGKTALNISWTKDAAAEGCDIYFARCGQSDFQLAGTAKADAKRFGIRDLKKHASYRAYVQAFRIVNGEKVYIGEASPVVHCITGGYNAKFANVRRVSVKKAKFRLKVGGTAKIRARVKTVKSGRKPVAHVNRLRYFTSDANVATVSATGRITAVGKGSCAIYVMANNGVRKTVRVTVK